MKTEIHVVDDEANAILRRIREEMRDLHMRGDVDRQHLADRMNEHPTTWPILYIDTATATNRHVLDVLKDSHFPLVIVETFEDLQAAMRERRIEPPLSMEKLTAMAQGMRSDVRFPNLAEVVNAMPALKLPRTDMKTSKRPALPQNRKRDRWN